MAQVAKKTNLPLVLDEKLVRNSGITITLDTGEVAFWQAIEQFLQVAGLTENPNPEPVKPTNSNQRYYTQQIDWGGYQPNNPALSTHDGKIHLMSGKTVAACSDKVVRVKAVAKDMGAHIRGSNELELILDVSPSPNVGWQGLNRLDIQRAVDDRNRVLKQSHIIGNDGGDSMGFDNDGVWFGLNGGVQFSSQYEFGPQGQTVNPYHVPIKLLAKDSYSKYLKELQGVISARMLSPLEALITVNDLGKATSDKIFSSDGRNLTIVEIKLAKNGLQTLRVKLSSPAFNQQMVFPGRFRGRMQPFMTIQSNGVDVMTNSPNLELQNAEGKILTGVSQFVSGQDYSPNGITTEYTMTVNTKAKGNSQPTKLVLKGRRTVDVEIPFTLKNVPLP